MSPFDKTYLIEKCPSMARQFSVNDFCKNIPCCRANPSSFSGSFLSRKFLHRQLLISTNCVCIKKNSIKNLLN